MGDQVPPPVEGHGGRLKDQGYYVIPVDKGTLRFGQGSFISRLCLKSSRDPAGMLPPEAFSERLIHQHDFIKDIELDGAGFTCGHGDSASPTPTHESKKNSKTSNGSPSGDFVDGTGGTGDTEFGPSDIDADKPMHDGACDAPDTPMVIDQDVSMKNIKDQKQSTSHMPEDTPDDHAEYHGGYFMYDFNAESTLEPSNVWIPVPTPNPPPLKRKLTPKPPSCPPPEHLLRSQSAEPGSSFKKQRETPGAGSKWA